MSQGVLRRKDKEMKPADVEDLLLRAEVAHFGTVGADGIPYVMPNLFVWADGALWLHTAVAAGHFSRNVGDGAAISFEVSEMGEVFPYGGFECDTSASYQSVIGFGRVEPVTEEAAKTRFFDFLMAKYADPSWDRPKGFYPRLHDVEVYRIVPDRMTGKVGPLPAASARWPARNDTKSPKAVPPKG